MRIHPRRATRAAAPHPPTTRRPGRFPDTARAAGAPRRLMAGTLAVLVALAGVGFGGGSAGAAQRRGPNHVEFRFHDARIDESSGMAASIRHPGIVYTLNDSGDSARVFAVGPDGKTRAVLRLAGVTARDWEAVTVGRDERGRSWVYAADIGDNLGGAWSHVAVYRFAEPARLKDATVHATKFRLRYAAGARNAEAAMINPRDGRLYVVSKEWNGGVYKAPAHLRAGRMNMLHRVGSAPAMATDAAWAPDGSSFVIRTYFSAQFYDRVGHEVTTTFLPSQKQGESITYTRDGRSLLIGSEGRHSPVWRVPVPEKLRPTPTPEPRASGRRGDAASGGGTADHSALTGLVIALAGAAVVVFLVRRRSR